jgi:CubicO group peptidase (beta-lactamase class C family)
VFPPSEVTTTNHRAEDDPRAAGLEVKDLAAMWDAVVALYETGLHPAIALCLRRRGVVLIDRAIGHLRGNAPGDREDAERPLALPGSLFNLFSASKAVTAMVGHLLDERGLVHLDDPVCEYIPEFGQKGKEWVTIRHVLTHRAGIPAVKGATVDVSLLADRKRILALLCDAEPASVPGRRLAYHAITGGYVLGEIIERVTGQPLREVLEGAISRPLGLAHFTYGVEPARLSEVAENAFTGLPAMPPLSYLLERSLGVGVAEATSLSNSREFLTAVVPSGNVITTADDTCRFFELLRCDGKLGPARVFDRRTVRRAVAEQSYLEIDSFLGLPVRYGMGFMLGGETFSPYGAHSPHAFGHIGFSNVIAWADPERELSCCMMTTGKPFITPGQLAWIGAIRTIAERCR